ncbi:MAG: YIP1 family protein [Myxococcota bacterium]
MASELRVEDEPPSMRSRIPIEGHGDGRWVRRCVRTLIGVLASPKNTFARCPEPVDHGRTLRYLATLRLAPWLALVAWLAIAFFSTDGRPLTPSRSVHTLLDPALAEALSVWLVLMVPVGMPLLYFLCGIFAHVAVGLTGGASRSVGASMRTLGYAMGPALLGVALLDLVLYTVGIDGSLYLGIVLGLSLSFLWAAGFGLARTHQISALRGFLVALLPTALLTTAIVLRAVLQLDVVPGFPEPTSPYVIP